MFRGIPTGEYVLRVTTYQGGAILQQFVSILDRPASLDVPLPSQGPRPTGAKVSITELRHPPARQALDAAVAAQRFSAAGHWDRAAGELERAVRLSPEFADAHANLGVQYLHMKRFEEAREEIERALAIGGPNARDLVNLGFAFSGLLRIPEAIEAARGALRLDGNNAGAHYIVGSLLGGNPVTRKEAVAHLEQAAKTLDSARKTLAALAELDRMAQAQR